MKDDGDLPEWAPLAKAIYERGHGLRKTTTLLKSELKLRGEKNPDTLCGMLHLRAGRSMECRDHDAWCCGIDINDVYDALVGIGAEWRVEKRVLAAREWHAKARAMRRAGASVAEIAEAVGRSKHYVQKYVAYHPAGADWPEREIEPMRGT